MDEDEKNFSGGRQADEAHYALGISSGKRKRRSKEGHDEHKIMIILNLTLISEISLL